MIEYKEWKIGLRFQDIETGEMGEWIQFPARKIPVDGSLAHAVRDIANGMNWPAALMQCEIVLIDSTSPRGVERVFEVEREVVNTFMIQEKD